MLDLKNESSGAGESHLRALQKPYVSLSTHTAPDKEPILRYSCQCAKRLGLLRLMRLIHPHTRLHPRRFLYFRIAQRLMIWSI